MKDHEIRELRERLAAEADRYNARGDYITSSFVKIGAADAGCVVTEAELLVFSIPRDLVPELQVAYLGYQYLIDIVPGDLFDARTAALIEKARHSVPPLKSFGHDVPFETGMSDERFFAWFAATFFGVCHRDAWAFYAKHTFNTHGITVYADER